MSSIAQIVTNIGILYKDEGFSKEVNLISWDDAEPVFDIRYWNLTNRDVIHHGISLDKLSVTSLLNGIKEMNYLYGKEQLDLKEVFNREVTISNMENTTCSFFNKPVLINPIDHHYSNWNLELNLVKWNDKFPSFSTEFNKNEPFYDIRLWNSDHTSCNFGLNFTDIELVNLYHLLKDYLKVTELQNRISRIKEIAHGYIADDLGSYVPDEKSKIYVSKKLERFNISLYDLRMLGLGPYDNALNVPRHESLLYYNDTDHSENFTSFSTEDPIEIINKWEAFCLLRNLKPTSLKRVAFSENDNEVFFNQDITYCDAVNEFIKDFVFTKNLSKDLNKKER